LTSTAKENQKDQYNCAMSDLNKLTSNLKSVFPQASVIKQFDEVTLSVYGNEIIKTLKKLKTSSQFKFLQLIDIAAVDYSQYPQKLFDNNRYAVVYHLLSIKNNQRLRVRAFVEDNDFPVIETATIVYANADWYEREAFDLFGVMFLNHPDLRRILTDYGFIGHPFRKDFPMIGNVEMRYDPEQKRVIYQPVTIESRNNVPRVIDEEGFRNG
jgi:NADH-quinone oxidoreductase subunit C